jgi:nucleoside-diphosphate-sugar epimerase
VIYGDGSDVHDYLFVADAAEGTCLALEHLADGAGLYNLGSGHGWTTRAIAETTQRLLQVALPPKHMPARGPRQALVVDITRARAALGFEPATALETGLAAEIAHFLAQANDRAGTQPPEETYGLFVRSNAPANR